MTFEEMDVTLPNGFHDAGLRSMEADYIACSATLELELHVGTPEDADPERYRRGKLNVRGLCLLVVDPPDASYSFVPRGESLWIQGDSVQRGDSPAVDAALAAVPTAAAYRFFVVDWNSFIYIAGEDVALEWQMD